MIFFHDAKSSHTHNGTDSVHSDSVALDATFDNERVRDAQRREPVAQERDECKMTQSYFDRLAGLAMSPVRAEMKWLAKRANFVRRCIRLRDKRSRECDIEWKGHAEMVLSAINAKRAELQQRICMKMKA